MPLASLRQMQPAKEEGSAQRAPVRKPHICFVAPYAWPVLSRDPDIKVVGGAEVQQCGIARLLAANGYRVSMVTFDYGQPSPVTIDGITVYKSFRPDAGVPVLRFLHPRLTSMWAALRRADADIYYQRSATMWTGVVAEFCRRQGKRSIYAGASDNDFLIGREQIVYRRDKWIYRRGLAQVDRIVAQNPGQVENCRRHHGRQAVLIPSCYQLPADAKPGKGDVVLWVGTIHRYKRPHWLLDMAERLPHRRFVLVGGPSVDAERNWPGYFDEMRERAAALPNVEFKGFLPLAQVEKQFDRARALVLTSEYEGMPNVFLQAWARGVPTIGSLDVGAPISPVYSNVEEGAQKLEALLSDEVLWARRSGETLAYFQRNHSSTEVLARYGQLFDELTK